MERSGKVGRATASIFMSIVLAATLTVPNAAFAQEAASSSTSAASATADTDATQASTTATAKAATDTASAASASAASGATETTVITAAADSTAASSDPEGRTTANVASDPTAAAKQKALNDSYNEAQSTSAQSIEMQNSLPSSYSLRNVDGKVYVDAVRQQGELSDCWANALSSCVASNILKQEGGAAAPGTTLSARQISWNISSPVNSKTVIAGRAIDADQYGEGIVIKFADGTNSALQGAQVLTSWQGLASETGLQAIPYQDSTGNKAAVAGDKWAITESQRDWSVAHVTDAELLPTPAIITTDAAGNQTYTYNAAGTAAIKQALVSNGAVQMDYSAADVHDAEFNAKTGAQYVGIGSLEKYNANGHAVAIVGWDDDYDASNFSTNPGHNGAFLVKNSWGLYGACAHTTYQGLSGPVDKETYTDASGIKRSVVLLRDASSPSYTLYPVVNGAVDSVNPIAAGLALYDEGDDLNFVYTDASGNKYTIAKEKAAGTENSPTWDGYFWLSYYDATIEQATSYTVDAPAANASGTYKYTHEYMYDYLGTASDMDAAAGAFDTTTTDAATGAVTTTIVQAANVFTAAANEALTAVTAVTQSAASTVQVAIYRLMNGAKSPTQSATSAPELTMTVNLANAGYHTIALSKPLYLHAGESFSVVETITNLNGAGYLPIELGSTSYNDFVWTAKCGAGESYISTDGGKTWVDVSTLSVADFPNSKIDGGDLYTKDERFVTSVGNVMIRALTVDWTPTPEPAPAAPTAATATASYAPATTATASAQPELPKTADSAVDACMLLALLAASGMGAALYARRKVLQ